MSSDKKIKANRENSQKSTGPTSREGKARSRINALKWGFFTKELVVAAAGEKQEDYDALLSAACIQFPPQDLVSAFFAKDLADIIWDLQRVRRYKTAEIRKQCNTIRHRRGLEKIAEVDSLKARFIRDCAAQCTSAPQSEDRRAFSVALERTRRQLEQTSMGLGFLLEQIEAVQKIVDQDGYLAAHILEWLINACGIEDEHIKYAMSLNQTAKAEMEKFGNNNEEADKTMFEQDKRLFSEVLKSKMETIRAMKKLIENLESAEEEDYVASLVMPPAEVLEKIHRAAAPLRRDLFKTLDTLREVFYG
jgi:hypothetical protein